ncbi:MAG: hypothetical protein OXE94_03825 [Aestuariivita sp.]|nr:hypothetical protein [Aestuariivita sp.]MCY4201697.1 hypothetical protein [Aestuariivita sp.]
MTVVPRSGGEQATDGNVAIRYVKVKLIALSVAFGANVTGISGSLISGE